ncbi:MAG: glutamyl-tRNA reductase [Dehalococcoidales bacterium]|jgi:glutamyl-tRNA reductase|nr:glutamyl-tRNA reductase [Dehalococcoidales bacterium]
MNISLVGVNHSTTPVAVREKVAINAEQLESSLLLLRHYVPHGIILSTCNRTEVYAIGNQPTEEAIINFLNATTGVSFTDLLPHIYLREDKTAFKHLFRIASGLDSMIIGEYEVLGQVRQALASAESVNMVTPQLRHIFQSAIRTGRQVRDETGISRSALSVSSVAVDLAAKIVSELRTCKMLIIGAGEAGRLVAKVARERGVSQIVVANRTWEKASLLTETLGGTAVELDNLQEELSTANIVVTCTGAPDRILDSKRVEEAMKKHPAFPMVIIDIAVPRNVEPEVKQIDNVFLYNIDDLTKVSKVNRQQRKGEVKAAEQIVAAEVTRCLAGWSAFETRPVIGALMEKAEDIRQQQLDKTLKKLRSLSEDERYSLDAMTKSIVTKILQDPIRYLKENKNSDDSPGIVGQLFQLEMEERGE